MIVRITGALAVLLYLTPVCAQAKGISLSASYLSNKTEFGNHSDKDGGYELSLAYSMNDYIAAELSYFDFGTHNLPQFPDAGGEIDGDGTALQVVGMYPVEKFTLYGKLGIVWWNRDGVLNTIAGPVSVNSDGNDMVYGIGCRYDFTDHIGVKIEYKRSQFDDDDLNIASVGISYSF